MSAHQRRWARELADVQRLLLPYVIEVDGEQFVDPTDAPTKFVSLHHDLMCIGYAKGWHQ